MTANTISEIRALLAEMDDKSPIDANGNRIIALSPERYELVRRLCELEYSYSPIWKERAEKDPDFWKTFSPGGIR